jgi:methionyl-tRNA formyltransferase
VNVILLGRKAAAARVLAVLLNRGAHVSAVVAPPRSDDATVDSMLRERAEAAGIPVVSDDCLYATLAGLTPDTLNLSRADLVISFLFWKRIERSLIELPRIGCFNFHPAPLPDFRGRRGYNSAILEGCVEYGASVHWVTEAIDTGDLVEVRKFPIAAHETAFSLERKTMNLLVGMFEDFIGRVLAGEPIARVPQGPGRSATKQQLLQQARIKPDDDSETVARKVRAFWYPPHSGATIEIGGRSYTLVDDAILADLGHLLHHRGESPQ